MKKNINFDLVQALFFILGFGVFSYYSYIFGVLGAGFYYITSLIIACTCFICAKLSMNQFKNYHNFKTLLNEINKKRCKKNVKK